MAEPARLVTESPDNPALPVPRGPGDLHEAASWISPSELKSRLSEMLERQKLIEEFIREAMVEGVDFGPPFKDSKKKTLLKPGGEKLLKLFGYIARPITDREESIVKLEQEIPFIHYVFRTEILDRHGRIVGVGNGSANSLEGKYRWRSANRKCPACGKETLFKSKYPPRGAPQGTPPGWWCSAPKGGCGADFKADDPEITSQELGRVINDDVGGLHHTIMRIAKKRSFLDGVQIATGTSGIFEIDTEEDEPEPREEPAARPQPAQQPQQQPRAAASSTASPGETVGEAETKEFIAAYTGAGHRASDIQRWLKEKHGIDIGRQRIPRAKFKELLDAVSDPTPFTPPAESSAQ